MDQQPEAVVVKEGFSAVQGCLVGAVILFIVLLGISITLAYRQFRDNTGEDAPTRPVMTSFREPAEPARFPAVQFRPTSL